MSLYLPGMEMPDDCLHCPCADLEYMDCNLMPGSGIGYNKRHDGCPLIPVPEHGRTIDADALDDILADQSEDAYNRTHAPRSWERALSAMRDYLEDSPTIIPADPVKEEKT